MNLKNAISFILILANVFFYSCKKNDDVAPIQSLSQTPTAKSQFDASNYGIYKGVFVGSSGIIVVNVNNDNTLTALLIVNGTTFNFTSSQTLLQNQAVTINFVSGSSSFTFSVAANGSNPIFTNLSIVGHPNAAIIAVKELSSTLVKCFEGTYAGGEAGVFNALIYGNVVKAIIKSSTNSVYTATGTATNNQISAATGNVSTGATFTGTLNGNDFSGTWVNAISKLNGTWTGSRTY